MNSLETLYRVKNVDFFLCIGVCDSMNDARKKAGICRDHAFKLVKRWKTAEWITVYEGTYDYTEVGARIVKGFHTMGWIGGKNERNR